MSNYSVDVVIDKDVLNAFVGRDKHALLLIAWLNENQTKAVVLIKHWREFFKYWELELKESSGEIKETFFAFIRGIVTPYRKKYGIEANIGVEDDMEDDAEDDVFATTKIADRHYATLKYIIVGDSNNYNDKLTKADNSQILTLRDFYYMLETKEADLFLKLNTSLDN